MYQTGFFILSGWGCEPAKFSYRFSRPSGPVEAFLACVGYLAKLCERNDEELERLGVPRVELSHEVYGMLGGLESRQVFVLGDPHRTTAEFRRLVENLTMVPAEIAEYDLEEFWRRLEVVEQCTAFRQAGP